MASSDGRDRMLPGFNYPPFAEHLMVELRFFFGQSFRSKKKSENIGLKTSTEQKIWQNDCLRDAVNTKVYYLSNASNSCAGSLRLERNRVTVCKAYLGLLAS